MNAYSDTQQPVVIVPVSPETQAWADFLDGYNAALRNADLSEMTTQDMQDGWWYCRQTVAAKASELDEDWLECDYDFIRGGC